MCSKLSMGLHFFRYLIYESWVFQDKLDCLKEILHFLEPMNLKFVKEQNGWQILVIIFWCNYPNLNPKYQKIIGLISYVNLPKKSISLFILSRINSKRCSKPQWHKVYLLANTAVAVVIYKLLKTQKKERCLHTL